MRVDNSFYKTTRDVRLHSSSQQVVAPDRRLLAAQPGLQSLFEECQLVTSELDLTRVLHQVVEYIVTLVDAQYGALGVLSLDGWLEQFIHVGVSEELVDRVGHLPEGHGILGAVNDSSRPIRLKDLTKDPRAVGFPEHHPPMDSFLGVPIKIRGETFGNLYLTNRAGGPFTAEDEELVTALAATAATAINNARHYGEARRAQQLSGALSEVTSALLASPSTDALGVLTESVAALTRAELVSVVVSEAVGKELHVDSARGEGASLIEGTSVPWIDCVLSRAMSGEPGIAPTDGDEPVPFMGDIPSASMIAVPLVVSGDRVAALCATRTANESPFTSSELELLSDFASQAGLAVALAWSRADRQRLELVEERARIARDLHDHAIQRLFGTGLGLQTLASADSNHAACLEAHVAEIDAAIADIRTAIFALQTHATSRTARHRLLDVMSELAPRLSTIPRMSFAGPVDLILEDSLADDAIAVVREALTNVARHAHADAVSVEINASDTHLTIIVEDNGIGPSSGSSRSSGTNNLSARARARGGEFQLTPRNSGGTRAQWHAPVPSSELS
ncbi:sensor histidine kinase [Nesterenkonia natronophila]|uniref:GAF domain-containing protein n=1 Tax=Nesterenkonia natronophila TaxID=2174932 RepID=A0A3A4F5Z4_9MICC|nr:GAF domain-containing protein [Nesterenkonia natronophila]RJN31880.1 GAF domain-containing protein [Nesterenkonia natronophila]